MKSLTLQPLTAFMAILLFSGCTPKVQVTMLTPAEISRASQTKQISVARFENDTINLASKIEANIARATIDGKPYFQTINRSELDRVLDEQRLQDSGLIDLDTTVEIGKLAGANAMILGSVTRPTMTNTRYTQTRRQCRNDECRDVEVSCTKRVVSTSAQIRMVDITRGDIIYGDTITKSRQYRRCRGDATSLPSLQVAGNHLSDLIAQEFVQKLLPQYVTFSVTLLNKPDIDYTKEQEDLLDNALEFIKHNRYDRAQTLLQELITTTARQSYVPIYNLGVLYEAQTEFARAKSLYQEADRLTQKPVDAINQAIIRIDQVKLQHSQAMQQINN